MTATLQRQFDLGLRSGRPLFSVSAAMAVLDRNEDEILYLIEDGQLSWAFDIRAMGAHRAEWRIWRRSIEQAFKGHQGAAALRSHQALEIERVIGEILPKGGTPTISRTRLARDLCCSHTHVTNLMDQGLIPSVQGQDGTHWHRVPLRSGVVEFLKARCRHQTPKEK